MIIEPREKIEELRALEVHHLDNLRKWYQRSIKNLKEDVQACKDEKDRADLTQLMMDFAQRYDRIRRRQLDEERRGQDPIVLLKSV